MNIADAALHPDDPLATNTPWEQVTVPESTLSPAQQLEYTIWSRILDGKHIFLVRPVGQIPSGVGGYYSLAAALKQKGLLH